MCLWGITQLEATCRYKHHNIKKAVRSWQRFTLGVFKHTVFFKCFATSCHRWSFLVLQEVWPTVSWSCRKCYQVFLVLQEVKRDCINCYSGWPKVTLGSPRARCPPTLSSFRPAVTNTRRRTQMSRSTSLSSLRSAPEGGRWEKQLLYTHTGPVSTPTHSLLLYTHTHTHRACSYTHTACPYSPVCVVFL